MCGNTTMSRSGSSGTTFGVGLGPVPLGSSRKDSPCRPLTGVRKPPSGPCSTPAPPLGRGLGLLLEHEQRLGPCSITSSLITHSSTSSREGMSYISRASRLEDRAQPAGAGLALEGAWRATARSAPSVKRSARPRTRRASGTASPARSSGSVRISISAPRRARSSVATTGSRPTNSGISRTSAGPRPGPPQHLAELALALLLHVGAEAHPLHADAALDDRRRGRRRRRRR